LGRQGKARAQVPDKARAALPRAGAAVAEVVAVAVEVVAAGAAMPAVAQLQQLLNSPLLVGQTEQSA
jgi:hypothetical protein